MLADDHPLRRLAEQVKIGIGEALPALDSGLTPLQLRRTLAIYVRHSGYQCSIREGVNRISLDGMPVGVITVEAAHAKRMLARPAAKRARQDAAKARLEQTAQPPKNEPQSAVATRLSCLKLRSHHPVVLAWPGCIGRLYRAGRQEHEAANRNICTHRDASVGRSKPNGSIEARVLPGKPLSIEIQRHRRRADDQ
jgi:sRNA-binding protein